jgi:uncharacterized protein (DUF2141 family)
VLKCLKVEIAFYILHFDLIIFETALKCIFFAFNIEKAFMKYVILFSICIFLRITLFARIDQQDRKPEITHGIDLTINNIRNKTGAIQIGVFDSEAGYPDKPVFSFTLAKDTIGSGRLRLFIPMKNPGIFGITVLDDENRNKRMDFVFGIKPREGFGFSNNPIVPGRKPPPFNETKINYHGGRLKVNINMKYI